MVSTQDPAKVKFIRNVNHRKLLPAFALICAALSSLSSINSSKHLTSSSLVRTPSESRSALTPTSHSSSTKYAFIVWSDQLGAATIGTPCTTASSVEFHPQCVTKHPTDGCDSTHCWSHHSTTIPLSPSAVASVRQRSTSSVRSSLQTTHR
ncbi:hypothetical protein U9M48_034618 [Paspalum notatum var. saurae]|uniref:Uncharacterized protein n=1 Tax=Paspalum notatum var. saurae TaxID=547442 RepID=A0AAQ3U9D9_PASNO